MLDLVFNRFTTVVFFEANLRHQLQKMSDSAAQYIHWDSKLHAPAACFTELVETGL